MFLEILVRVIRETKMLTYLKKIRKYDNYKSLIIINYCLFEFKIIIFNKFIIFIIANSIQYI